MTLSPQAADSHAESESPTPNSASRSRSAVNDRIRNVPEGAIRGKVARILHVRPNELLFDFCTLPESEQRAFITTVPVNRISEIVCSAYPHMLESWAQGTLEWGTHEQSVRHFFGNLLPYIWFSLMLDEPDTETAIRVLRFVGLVHRSVNRNKIFRLAHQRLEKDQQDVRAFLDVAEPLLTHYR